MSVARNEMIGRDEIIRGALSSVAPRADCYHWAWESGLYLSRDALLEQLATAGASVLVVDVRDEDVAGGMISGAINRPDGQWDDTVVVELLYGRRCGTIVLHCMESARRAPRCAFRLVKALDALELAGVPPDPRPEVRVLEGGMDQWMRRHWQDATKVSGYDDDFWGYALMNGTQIIGGDDERGDNDGKPAHTLYQRPADQPATPWSGAGEEAVGKSGGGADPAGAGTMAGGVPRAI